jgi:hypothetical protein
LKRNGVVNEYELFKSAGKTKNHGYSIRCNVKGGAKIQYVAFQFDGQTRRDHFAPWYMGGGGGKSRGKNQVIPVDYLSNGPCGTNKEVMVTGTNWRGGTCFQEKFTLRTKC